MGSAADVLAVSGLPASEARALLAWAGRCTRESLIAHPEREVGGESLVRFEGLVRQRLAGEPLAYLLGEKEFYGRPFRVTRDVLIPRPETELLVDAAIALLRGRPASRVLDLGTGSGNIAVTLALEIAGAAVTAIDARAAALAVARSNADRLGAGVTLAESDWFSEVSGAFDLIVSNPPYVADGDPHLADLNFEPIAALTAGADGLSCLRHIAQAAPAFLSPGGWLLVEHGHDQGEAVRTLFVGAGLVEVQTHPDFSGHSRVCAGRARESPAVAC